MSRSTLALLLALAFPASAQQFGVGGQVVSGGVTQQWFGYGKPNGTSGPGVYMTPPRACVGWWDPGSPNTVWGGRNGGGTDDFLDNDSATPVTEANYPIVVWGHAQIVSTASSAILLMFSNSSGSESFFISTTATAQLRASSADGGVQSDAVTSAGAITNNMAFRYVAVFESATSRAIYCTADTTGGTNTTSSAPAGIDRVRFFGWRDATADWQGAAGPTYVFSNATVPSSDQRLAFLRDGHNPETIMQTQAAALWCVGGDTLTDQRGNVDLTVDGNGVVHRDLLWLVPDESGQNNALFWAKAVGTSNAPTRESVAALNSQAFGSYNASSSSCGLRTAANRTPVTAEPNQLYMVVDIDTKANADVIGAISDDAGTNNYWRLDMSATVFRATINGAGAGVQSADSLNFTLDTGYLVWGSFASGTSRTCETNGGDQGTNSTSRTVSGIDHVSVMAYLGTSTAASTDGQHGLVVILDTSSTAGQPSIERFTSAAYNLGF